MLLNLDLATIAFQIVNFLVLVVLLYYFLFRPMMRRVGERAAEKERLAQEAARDRQEAAQLRSEWEQRLASAEEEADVILVTSQQQGENQRRQLLEETRAEVERTLVEAHADAYRLRQQAVEDFHDQLLDSVLQVSGQLIGRVAPPQVHGTMVQRLNDRIWELGRSDIQRVEAFRRALGDRVPTAHVSTAAPLSPQQQGELVRTLSALADRNINLELETDLDLVAGIKVRMADIVVDSSVAGQLDALRQEVAGVLKERLNE